MSSPDVSTDFASLDLNDDVVRNLHDLGYAQMTPIQASALPSVLAGDDVIAQAKTGSGKTVAFGLGVLREVEVRRFSVQALVLCPTRELAEQVAHEVRRLARTTANLKVLTLCGGVPIRPQKHSLQHGAHVVVGTPGRVLDHLRKQSLDVDDVRLLVLDEADRMLDMGFADAIDEVVQQLPQRRQTLLFSATFPEQTDALAEAVTRDALRVVVDDVHDDGHIRQQMLAVRDGDDRERRLKQALLAWSPTLALVFCATKRSCQSVADALVDEGFSAGVLHGDLDQKQRDQAMVQAHHGSIQVLVATDVAARGLDVDDVDLVVNLHPARDADTHVHRVGRTGRAQRRGRALSLLTARDQAQVADWQVAFETLGADVFDDVDLMQPPPRPSYVSLEIAAGKKQKLRPGDILGALTQDGGLAADDVGRIHIRAQVSYVAVRRDVARQALQQLQHGRLKGRRFRARRLR